jgi:branched-chain amino acid transport system ATP-binding protein
MPTHRSVSLHVAGLHAGYQGGTVLRGVDLDLTAGRVLAVLGGNGAGKTTLIHTLAGIGQARQTGGRVLLGDADVTCDVSTWTAHRRARAGLALVPQRRRVFATLTVAEHLTLLPHATDPTRTWSVERLVTVFPQLARRLTSQARHLSGGEQQMLAIARALLTQPRLLLLDEPTEGLSPPVVQRVTQIIDDLAADGVAVLLATPDLELARTVANQVAVLTAGQASAWFEPASLPDDADQLLSALAPLPITGQGSATARVWARPHGYSGTPTIAPLSRRDEGAR